MLFQTTAQLDDIIDPNSVTAVDIGKAIGVIVLSIILAYLVRRLLTKYLKRLDQLSDPISAMLTRFAGYFVITMGVLLALPLLGFQLQPAMILLLVVGVLIFFAARPLMEDFSAGLVLQTRSPFVIGDLIEHDGHRGTVLEIDGRATVLLTPEGVTVRIPNTTFLSAPIVNLSVDEHRRSTVSVGVAYGTDLDNAARVLLEAVTDLTHVLDEPAPRVFATSYGDSSIDFDVWIWHTPTMPAEAMAMDQAVRSINRALGAAGIVIPFPQRDIWYRNSVPLPDGEGDST